MTEVRGAVEYALYWLAVNRPDVLRSAEVNEGMAMIAENREAHAVAVAIADRDRKAVAA